MVEVPLGHPRPPLPVTGTGATDRTGPWAKGIVGVTGLIVLSVAAGPARRPE